MGQLVLLVVAAAWAAVLVPPLLRSRIENRPNSSVTDFRNQLSSLQRAMPSRGVAMRSMARPLAPSPLSRPAAAGRPPLRSGVRTHGRAQPGPQHRPAGPSRRRAPRLYDATPRGPQPRRATRRRGPDRSPRPPLGRSAPATPSSGAGPTCCSCSSSSPPARCSSPPRPRPQAMLYVFVRRVHRPRAATSTCSASCASASSEPARRARRAGRGAAARRTASGTPRCVVPRRTARPSRRQTADRWSHAV